MWLSANFSNAVILGRINILIWCLLQESACSVFCILLKELQRVMETDSGPFSDACVSIQFLVVYLFFQNLPLAFVCGSQ